MIRKEEFVVIQTLHKRGVYQKDIAEELQVHPKTVSRALKRPGGRRGSASPRRGWASARRRPCCTEAGSARARRWVATSRSARWSPGRRR